ncbi:hypothetical protein [Ochrobactrum sp. AP1BH01-1]|uniref:hypothetical protein n=1 Tax=Ochrobactrum sp. AP1BH01-1 TaxID=2823874 RepID=UPI001B374103|nr:hypothetical protein [Ochrobactrum sp. AP1BH01-1]MBQ0710670.1 hypothetical protein [Ochrobactrum sp. AP1BH01-1]
MRNKHLDHAVGILRAAGGSVVGRTKFQKIAYLLTAAGYENEFVFEYKHYGPYSEDLSTALEFANLLSIINEEQRATNWGGRYSIYSIADGEEEHDDRTRLARMAKNADTILLELAATALFLKKNGFEAPWEETERRKPEKSTDGRLDQAKRLYEQLQSINTPIPLPAL